jgi:hypothetical protein
VVGGGDYRFQFLLSLKRSSRPLPWPAADGSPFLIKQGLPAAGRILRRLFCPAAHVFFPILRSLVACGPHVFAPFEEVEELASSTHISEKDFFSNRSPRKRNCRLFEEYVKVRQNHCAGGMIFNLIL